MLSSLLLCRPVAMWPGRGLGLLLPAEGGAKPRLVASGSTGTFGDDHVYLSDDHGQSWRPAANGSALRGHGLDESQVAVIT